MSSMSSSTSSSVCPEIHRHLSDMCYPQYHTECGHDHHQTSPSSSSTYDWKQACKDAGVNQWKAMKGTPEYELAKAAFVAGKKREDEANGIVTPVKPSDLPIATPSTLMPSDPDRELWAQCCRDLKIKFAYKGTEEYNRVKQLFKERKQAQEDQ